MIRAFSGALCGIASLSILAAACGSDNAPGSPEGGVSGAGGSSRATGGERSGSGGDAGAGGNGGTAGGDTGLDGGGAGGGDSSAGGNPSGSDSGAPDAGAGLPEEILGSPLVKAALEAAAAKGYPLHTHTGRNAPDITGYYRKPESEGRFVATGNGEGVGNGVFGIEVRVTVDANDEVDEASLSYGQGRIVGSSIESGIVLRGDGNELTLYTNYHAKCPYGGSDFEVDGFSVTSAEVLPETGTWIFVRRLIVTIATRGTASDDCKAAFVGDSEVVGGWGLSESPRYQRIAPAELTYMCLDGDEGYIAGETWLRGSTPCMCTDGYSVDCF